MATPTTGTAICPYCATVQERVMKNEHIVSGPLITDLDDLRRHRDESGDRVIDLTPDAPDHEKVTATRPAMRVVELDGLTVRVPSGFRPIFRHYCPTIREGDRTLGAGHVVTLYADTEGGSVQ